METKRFILLDIDYVTENGRPVVRLFGKERGEDKGRSIIALDRHFRPYIYVIPKGNIEDCIRQINTLEVDEIKHVQKKDIGTPKEMVEVILFHPQDVPKLRDKILDLSEVREIREHDIPFYRRYLIDNALTPMGKVKARGNCKTQKSGPGISSTDENLCIFDIDGKPEPVAGEIPDLKVMSFDIEVRNPKGT